MAIRDELQKIADAIRKIKGSTERIKAKNFETEINKLSYIDDVTTGKIESIEGKTIIPSTSDQIIQAGKYIKGNQIIKGDANLKPEYILRGKRIDEKETSISIFGVKGTLDRARKFNRYTEGSGFYGNQVADCARSYHLAKMNGTAKFRYSQSKGICGNGVLTDENGRCYMDCSTFLNLILRGIDFKNSPYYQAKNKSNITLMSLGLDKYVLSEKCKESNYVWADIYLDMQTDEELKYSFKQGYKSIRTAAEIAEYFYSQGYTLYEYSTSPTTVPTNLLGGDLLFWAKEDASDTQKTRFKGISHVGIVARDKIHFYQATGYVDERITETIFCSEIEDHLNELIYIARPNYNPINIPITPKGINLLPQYYYDSLEISSEKTSNGVTFSSRVNGGFKVQRTSNSDEHSTFYIYNYDRPVKLEKGRYKLSGTPKHATASSTGTDKYWGLSVKDADKRNDGVTNGSLTDINGNVVWDRGQGCTFEVDETINAYVYFFVSRSLTNTDEYNVIPKLERIS